MCKFLRTCVAIVLLLFVFPVGVSCAQSGEAGRMVFYPTDVADARELSYLRDSMRLMLASRLASVTGGEVRLEKKMDSGRDFAFYRVMSRLVIIKDGVELSTKVFRPSEEKPLHFKTVAKDSAGILKAVDVLVADMGKALFQVQDSPEISKAPGKKMDEKSDVNTSHPDRAIKSNSGFGLSISQEAFTGQIAIEVQSKERYKSAVLPVRSQGMTAGDIDGDGLDEILISTNTKLYIYQLREQKIVHLTTIPLPGALKVHGLNVADLDKNGLMEIYISTTRDNEPHSFVLEWHPVTGIKWLYENVYWYLRPLDIPGEGTVLAGQKGGLEGFVQPGVYRMTFQAAEKITGGERISLPESVNLFDFVLADLDGDRIPEVVTIDRKERLKVYSRTLELLYTSPAGFGGRELSEGYNAPIRLVVSDFDQNGKQDILLVDNELYSPKILSDTRLYKNGQVRGLLWDGMGFMEMWHTNIFQKAVVDFQFLSSAGGEKGATVKGRLFIVEPEKGDFLEGFLLGSGGSRLSVYGMDFLPKDNTVVE